MTEAIHEMSGVELGRYIADGHITPTEVIEYFEDRAKSVNRAINAFTYTKFDEAKDEAKRLEHKLARKEELGPLAGVPVALKDFLPSKKGWLNSHGGVPCLQFEDTADSEFWKAANKAGAIAVGKTNAPAFGFRGATDNVMYGPTSTPFNILRNSGGSSGGSAAAVAAGLISIGEGGDGGGSIRVPSAWCNCFGYKPSVGTVPSVCRPDGWTATHPYCHNGSITKTVEDSATMLNYMAHYDPMDPLSIPWPKKDFVQLMKQPIKGVRIGLTANFDLFAVDPEIAHIVMESATVLEEAGAIIKPINFNFKHSAREYADMWCRSISIDTAIDLQMWKDEIGLDILKDYKDEVPYEFIYWNTQARQSTIFDYRRFNDLRTEILDEHERIFEDFDIIISPTVSCEPTFNRNDGDTKGPKMIAGKHVDPLIGFCQTFLQNFTGHPAASIPAGLTKDGLPVGMQIIGRKFKDEDVFAVSYAYEQLKPWRQYYKKSYDCYSQYLRQVADR